MGMKSLRFYGNLMSFADSKEQNNAKFKTMFCGICSLPNNFLPLIKNVNGRAFTKQNRSPLLMEGLLQKKKRSPLLMEGLLQKIIAHHY
jgi:hypothetical protein